MFDTEPPSLPRPIGVIMLDLLERVALSDDRGVIMGSEKQVGNSATSNRPGHVVY